MADEIVQDDMENVNNDYANNIDAILASPDDEDIMKDFNFDDILDSSADRNVVENAENEGINQEAFSEGYSVESTDNVGNEASVVDAFAQDGSAIENNINIESNTIGEQSEIEQNNYMETSNVGDIIDNNATDFMAEGNSWQSSENDIEKNNDELSDNYNDNMENGVLSDDTVLGQSSVLDESEAMPQVDSSYDDYTADVEKADNFSMSSSLDEVSNIGFLREYDGSIESRVYTIDKKFESEDFNGNEDCETVHVNVGYDTYGWNVEFANNVTMSLRDVKEYQKRQGCLPFNSGTIRYGNKVLRFRDVKRIVVYETVKYFSYGA